MFQSMPCLLDGVVSHQSCLGLFEAFWSDAQHSATISYTTWIRLVSCATELLSKASVFFGLQCALW